MLIMSFDFTIGTRIGQGAFGDVYMGTNMKTGEEVAIKIEKHQKDKDTDDRKDKHVLQHEYQIYQELHNSNYTPVVPNIYWFGTNKFNNVDSDIMVMQPLGESLQTLHASCNNKFSLKTTLMVGLQMFDRIKALHDNSFIHRDLKPDNFLIGINNNKHLIYLIDLGLAKRFKNKDRVHIKFVTGKKLVGTARYASINSHIGNELSRRDDMESLIYLLIYFVKGSLPWQGINCQDREEKYRLIGECKMKTSIIDLCNGLPEGFRLYLQNVKCLDFKAKPDYHYLRSLIINIFTEYGFSYDNVYDWISVRSPSQSKQRSKLEKPDSVANNK